MVQTSGVELKATRREVLGKKVKQLRRQGIIPANIYGHNVESLAVQVKADDLKHVIKTAGRNDIIYVRLDGEEPRPTFLKTVQRDAIGERILHVDLLQISLKEKVRIEVPLHLVGVPPAVDVHGGILMHGIDRVAVEALPTDVPSFLEVDVSVLEEIDQALHVSDLVVPAGVTVLTDPEVVVAKVSAPAVERVEEVAVEEEAAAVEREEAAEAAGEAPGGESGRESGD
jgi:large subunit ribosomal protein L25